MLYTIFTLLVINVFGIVHYNSFYTICFVLFWLSNHTHKTSVHWILDKTMTILDKTCIILRFISLRTVINDQERALHKNIINRAAYTLANLLKLSQLAAYDGGRYPALW